MESAEILFKKHFSGVLLNAILPIIGVQNKTWFSFKEAELGKTG
jgi:hypothetical protein